MTKTVMDIAKMEQDAIWYDADEALRYAMEDMPALEMALQQLGDSPAETRVKGTAKMVMQWAKLAACKRGINNPMT